MNWRPLVFGNKIRRNGAEPVLHGSKWAGQHAMFCLRAQSTSATLHSVAEPVSPGRRQIFVAVPYWVVHSLRSYYRLWSVALLTQRLNALFAWRHFVHIGLILYAFLQKSHIWHFRGRFNTGTEFVATEPCFGGYVGQFSTYDPTIYQKFEISMAFLPRCMECSRGIAMGILSVCPSVCPSNACIVTKRKKAMFRFLYHMKEHLS